MSAKDLRIREFTFSNWNRIRILYVAYVHTVDAKPLCLVSDTTNQIVDHAHEACGQPRPRDEDGIKPNGVIRRQKMESVRCY